MGYFVSLFNERMDLAFPNWRPLFFVVRENNEGKRQSSRLAQEYGEKVTPVKKTYFTNLIIVINEYVHSIAAVKTVAAREILVFQSVLFAWVTGTSKCSHYSVIINLPLPFSFLFTIQPCDLTQSLILKNIYLNLKSILSLWRTCCHLHVYTLDSFFRTLLNAFSCIQSLFCDLFFLLGGKNTL